MRKLLNNPWFVAAAALIALLMAGKSVLSGITGSYPPAAVMATMPAAEGAEPSETAATSLPADGALKALAVPVTLRDPFAPRSKAEAGAETLVQPDVVDRVHLSAIWTQGNATLVLINERICEAGDEIGRVKIESASQDGVWVTHWKGRDFVSLGAEFVLNTPAGTALAAGSLHSAL